MPGPVTAKPASLTRFWFTFDEPVTPRQYLVHGSALMVLKYAIDALLVRPVAHRWWMPWDYLSSVLTLTQKTLEAAPVWLLPLLGLLTLPFLWVGITLTMRRAIDANMSPWLALLFMVPFVNYILIALLCIAPSREPSPEADRPTTPAPIPAHALMAMLPGLLLGLVMLTVSVYGLKNYGVALFFFTPFGVGALTAWSLNRSAPVPLRQTVQLVLLTLAVLGTLLLVLGREGAICIAMALPLAAMVSVMGAVVGRRIALLRHDSFRAATFGLLALPAAAFLEPRSTTGTILHEVRSSVTIDAAPMDVWAQVIAFPAIPEPGDWFFRMGIAYPRYARIEGTGVGAVRYCVFSTGPFVEPITVWEPGRRLAFDVSSAPVPLRELTPYTDVKPPHLDGFLKSRRGEFRLIALPDGRTRLEGSTWYTVAMGPEAYWQMFGDYLIHRIHVRVLEHIREQVEHPVGGSAALPLPPQVPWARTAPM